MGKPGRVKRKRDKLGCTSDTVYGKACIGTTEGSPYYQKWPLTCML